MTQPRYLDDDYEPDLIDLAIVRQIVEHDRQWNIYKKRILQGNCALLRASIFDGWWTDYLMTQMNYHKACLGVLFSRLNVYSRQKSQ